MTSSREHILARLRAARRPFPDAPMRPRHYAPVTGIDAGDREALLARFIEAAQAVHTQVQVVDGDAAAAKVLLQALKERAITNVLAWHFTHIPVRGLKQQLQAAGVHIQQPHIKEENRANTLEKAHQAGAGITGVDAIAATTGTLIVSSGKGRGRLPTILPPLHIAVAGLDQLVGRLEDWLAQQRTSAHEDLRARANIAFISGPSATGDIEMMKVLGVHGPAELIAIIKR